MQDSVRHSLNIYNLIKTRNFPELQKVWDQLSPEEDGYFDMVMTLNRAVPKLAKASGVSLCGDVDFAEFMQILDPSCVISTETRKGLDGIKNFQRLLRETPSDPIDMGYAGRTGSGKTTTLRTLLDATTS